MSCDEEELFNIYEFDLKSSKKKPRQLTSASDVSDVDPIYLPDDSIVFSSSRDLKYVPCDSQIVPQLFRMNSDGQNIHQITRSTAHENQISLMSDGRILYSRWDYIDRNFGDGHGFWVTNPDGTNHDLEKQHKPSFHRLDSQEDPGKRQLSVYPWDAPWKSGRRPGHH
jgi:hypothetical protein